MDPLYSSNPDDPGWGYLTNPDGTVTYSVDPAQTQSTAPPPAPLTSTQPAPLMSVPEDAPAPSPTAPLATTPTPQTAGMTPRAAGLLRRVDSIHQNFPGLQLSGAQVQKAVDPSVLDPIIADRTASADALATTAEQQGQAKTDRQTASIDRQTYLAQGQQATAQAAAEDAAKRKRVNDLQVGALAAQTDPAIDPDRYVSNMSGGKKIAMVVLASLQGAFNNTNSWQGKAPTQGNAVLDIINKGIDEDIQSQKAQIASGQIRRGNLIAHFKELGMDDKAAELAARAQSSAMIARLTDLEAARAGAPEAAENGKMLAAQIRAKNADDNNQLKLTLGTDRTVEAFARPVAVKATNAAETFAKYLGAREAYEKAGATPEQLSAFDSANGIPKGFQPGGESQTARENRVKDETLSEDQAKAQSAAATISAFGQTLNDAGYLSRDPKTQQWRATPGWRSNIISPTKGENLQGYLGHAKPITDARAGAQEAIGRLESGGMISTVEAENFRQLLGDDDQTPEQLASHLNTIETLVAGRIKVGHGAPSQTAAQAGFQKVGR